MTKDDIIRMAREAGIYRPYWEDDEDPSKDSPRWVTVGPIPPLLERFAALVAAAEREACAKVCESLFDADDDSCDEAEQCAAAIRERGKK